jgi:hypothetical protein
LVSGDLTAGYDPGGKILANALETAFNSATSSKEQRRMRYSKF